MVRIRITTTRLCIAPMNTADDAQARLRLLQLTSPALPVGAYAYSQGLEQAIEAGWVTGAEQLQDWVGGLLQHTLCTLDIPVLLRLHAAWCAHDQLAVRHWTGWLHACRESAELQAEDRQLGNALARLLVDLGLEEARPWQADAQATYATLVRTGRSALAHRCARYGAGLSVELVRKPDHGRAETHAAGSDRRPTHPVGAD